MATISLTVNGAPKSVQANENDYLLYVLRDKLELTGPKYGCGVGVCGACTCHAATPVGAYEADSGYSGQAITAPKNKFRPCVTKLKQVAAGNNITTIEGLKAHPSGIGAKLIASWTKFDVAQCGFCQAGQLMTAFDLLSRGGGVPSDQAIDDAMGANLCRCGTYPRIRAAIKDAAA